MFRVFLIPIDNNFFPLKDAESLPVMLLRNVCFFCDSGGPQSIKKCLEVRSKELTIPMLGHIVHCLANVSYITFFLTCKFYTEAITRAN